MKQIKLIALDLDDTLLLPDRTISKLNRSIIAQVRELGVQVVIATGRMYRAAVHYAWDLQLDLPLIAYQGALIKTTRSGDVLRSLELTKDQCKEVLKFLSQHQVHTNLYIGDELYVAEMNEVAARYAAFSSVPVHVVGDLSAFEFAQATKVVAIGEPNHLQYILEPEAVALFNNTLSINTSRPYFLEFGHREAKKSCALQFLGERLGISREEILAIGDGVNDLDMIQYAGIGVAMGNADERLKQAADFITASNTEDGVAQAIQCWVLNNRS